MSVSRSVSKPVARAVARGVSDFGVSNVGGGGSSPSVPDNTITVDGKLLTIRSTYYVTIGN